MINAKQSLVGTLNTAIEYVQPVTQEKEITPKEEIQEVTPDDGYTGLSKVTVDPIPSEYTKVEGTLDITTNGEYDVKSYEKANVNVGELKIKNAAYLFYSNARTDQIDELLPLIDKDCSNFASMFHYFNGETLPEIDVSNGTRFNNFLMNASKIINFGGLKNMGKAFSTTQSASYYDYNLNVSSSKNLSYESLMNIINNLYDIASIGVKTQDLVLGTTNLAKLSEEEQLIAMVKGWNVY